MVDCLIVGGGAIGLSLAYQLAGEGRTVRVVERGPTGREASWAGAGILPPRRPRDGEDALGRLAELSFALHPEWSRDLREQTGIDNGLQRCGGIYLAREEAAERQLAEQADDWRQRGVTAERLDAAQLRALEPGLLPQGAVETLRAAYHLPDEYQLRNPRHLKALAAACRLRGVEISTHLPVEDFVIRRGVMKEIIAGGETLRAAQFCITAGSWTAALVRRLGYSLAIRPIRGQIALLQTPLPPTLRVINEGKRYLVPRPDGRTLVGSTEEDVGFDARPTAGVIADLVAFACSLAPDLRAAQLARTWAGLRPMTPDGQPYLGPVPDTENVFVAAGHYRAGLELSCATAVVMSQLLHGETPAVDLTPFRLDRHLMTSLPPNS